MIAARPSMVLSHKPGDKLFIDFGGDKLCYTDRATGELICCEVFVATLPYSDYGYAMAVESRQIPGFLYAPEQCLLHLGGVPAALVPDNLKSAVIKANRYEPTLSQALDDFAAHYGTAVIPARVRSPKDKALVVNQVKLVYSRVYAKLRNMQFFSINSLNKAIGEKMREHNQTRMRLHGIVDAYRALQEARRLHELTLDEGLEILLQAKDSERENKRQRLAHQAGFRYKASMEELKTDPARGVDKQLIATLSTGDYISKGIPMLITGATGCGKSFMASALGHQACVQGYKVKYFNIQKLMIKMRMGRLEGSIFKFFEKISKNHLLILDDFGLTGLDRQQQMDLMELIEVRHAKMANGVLVVTTEKEFVMVEMFGKKAQSNTYRH